MRTTIDLDEELLDKARRVTGMEGRAALIHAGLRALIERESARRLARLGGAEAQLRPVSRYPLEKSRGSNKKYTDL